jgi:hypothetical protein
VPHILFFLTLFNSAEAQDPRHKIWSEGLIHLDDETTLRGLIHYDVNIRLIKFRRGAEDIDELALHEKRIRLMSYADTTHGVTRNFKAILVSEKDSGFKGSVLFEVLIEMKEFSVVSRMYPIKPGTKLPTRLQNDNHYENIYIVKEKGEIELLATFTPGRYGMNMGRISPHLNDTLLKRAMGARWEIVKAYVKEQRLRLKSKDGLLEALKYYQQLQV